MNNCRNLKAGDRVILKRGNTETERVVHSRVGDTITLEGMLFVKFKTNNGKLLVNRNSMKILDDKSLDLSIKPI